LLISGDPLVNYKIMTNFDIFMNSAINEAKVSLREGNSAASSKLGKLLDKLNDARCRIINRR